MVRSFIMVAQTPVSTSRWIALAVLCAALAPSAWLAWTWRAMPQTGIFHDDAIYLVSAKSLADGRGYRIASLPGEPYQTKYPPLYPAALSLVWRLDSSFPANLPKVMLICWLALAGAVLLAWRLLAGSGFGEWESVGLAAFLALSPALVQFGVMAMSELPFCVFLFAALMAAERGRAVWAGLLGGLAFLTRGAALPLLVTVPAVYAWRGNLRAAARFAVAMLPAVAGWQWWAAAHRAPADPLTLFYTDYFGYHRHDVSLAEWPELAVFNLNPATKALAELVLFDEEAGLLELTLARLLTAAMILGTVRLMRQGRLAHFGIFGAAYVAQFLFWNYPPTHRFFLPLAPLAVAGVWTEVKALGAIIRAAFDKKGADRVVAVAIGALVLWLGVSIARHSYRGIFHFLPPVFAERQRLLEEKRLAYNWLAAQPPSGDRVAAGLLSYQDPLDYLYTGWRGVSLRVPPGVIKRGDQDEVNRFFGDLPTLLRDHSVGLAVVGAADYQMESPNVTLPAYLSIFKKEEDFELLYKGKYTKVYRLRPAQTASSSPARQAR